LRTPVPFRTDEKMEMRAIDAKAVTIYSVENDRIGLILYKLYRGEDKVKGM